MSERKWIGWDRAASGPWSGAPTPTPLLTVASAAGISVADDAYTADGSPVADRDWPFVFDADAANSTYGAGKWELRLAYAVKVDAGTGYLRLRQVDGTATMGNEASLTATSLTAAVGAAATTNLPASGVVRCRVQAKVTTGNTLTIESLRVEARAKE
ncbi:MAG: hypothetical protein Q8R92_21150 [Deltaproteobacteria bacterium]|nr:hypothetical protein [Deltaproteobacteria bacterium]